MLLQFGLAEAVLAALSCHVRHDTYGVRTEQLPNGLHVLHAITPLKIAGTLIFAEPFVESDRSG